MPAPVTTVHVIRKRLKTWQIDKIHILVISWVLSSIIVVGSWPTSLITMSIKKTALATPGNSAKKDLKKGATPIVSDGGTTAEGNDVQVLFQTSFSASMDLAPYKCICPSSLLRSLQISPGNMVAIENPNTGNFVISRAFVQKRSIPSQSNNERLVMHRLWQINFDGMESKKVVVKSMRDPR